MRSRQKEKLAKARREVARAFIKSEWRKVAFGSVFGLLLSLTKRLLFNDADFHVRVVEHFRRLAVHPGYEGFDAYSAPLFIVASLCCISFLIFVFPFVTRLIRSWLQGVVSGLSFFWTASFFYFFALTNLSISQQLWFSCGAAMAATVACYGLHTYALYRNAELFEVRNLAIPSKVPGKVTFSAGRGMVEGRSYSGDYSDMSPEVPIVDWDQDLLQRSSLVESIASTVLVSRSSIVAIEGSYGDGKTSILNLLRNAIERHAIVVKFSSWLPGSHESLALDLFGDIATECKKQFFMPQLRRQLLAYAKTICGTIPSLKALPTLFSPISQNDEIEEIQRALGKLPKRVVVLLDEMDRLDKEELRVVFKILRGAANFPNVSYVCALDREAVLKAYFGEKSPESVRYLEKFFPVSYAVPKLDSNLLFDAFDDSIVTRYGGLGWFDVETAKELSKELRLIWDGALKNVCTNMRKVTLVANDVSVAARRLKFEVDPLDLTLLEVIRRFFPSLYQELWQNQQTLTRDADEGWKEKLRSRSDGDEPRKQFIDHVIASYGKDAAQLLAYVFPALPKQTQDFEYLNPGSPARRNTEKRAADPNFFPIYFRYQVPETMFSQTEMETFFRAIPGPPFAEVEKVFVETLGTTKTGSPRRLDFLSRLAGLAPRIAKPRLCEDIVISLARHAHEYQYDGFLDMAAEAGKAIICVFTFAQRFSKTDEAQSILASAISESSDDTFSVRILRYCKPEKNQILTDFSKISFEALENVFLSRMERRYGAQAHVEQVNIAHGDREAFMMWAKSSPGKRASEIEFWRRFIGQSRKRLAGAVRMVFPSNVLWEVDPSQHIELLFPLDEFRKLDEELPPDELTADESRDLKRLRKLLNGDYRSGVPYPGTENLE